MELNISKAVEKIISRVKTQIQEYTQKLKSNTVAQKKNTKATTNLTMSYKNKTVAIDAAAKATGKASKKTKKHSDDAVLAYRNNRLLSNSFAVLRSKLLLYSFGAGLVSKSIGEALAQQQTYEDSVARLGQVLETTGGIMGLTTEQITSMNAALESQLGIAETTLNNTSALLATFTGIGQDVFPETQQAVIDMANAMNQGNVSMENLRSTSIMVGKAMNDPILGLNALSRNGVKFTATQKTAIRSFVVMGQESKAQAIILKELQKEFGGSRENMGEWQKTVSQFSVEWDNLKKKFGAEFQDDVMALMELTRNLIAAIDPDKVIRFAKAFGMQATGLLLVRTALIKYIAFQASAAAGTASWTTRLRANLSALNFVKNGTLAANTAVKLLSSTMGGLGLTAIISGLSYLWSQYTGEAKKATNAQMGLNDAMGDSPAQTEEEQYQKDVLAIKSKIRGNQQEIDRLEKKGVESGKEAAKAMKRMQQFGEQKIINEKVVWDINQRGNFNAAKSDYDRHIANQLAYQKQHDNALESLEVQEEILDKRKKEELNRIALAEEARREAQYARDLNNAQIKIIHNMQKQTAEIETQAAFKKAMKGSDLESYRGAEESMILLQSITKDPNLMAAFSKYEEEGKNILQQLEAFKKGSLAAGGASKRFIENLEREVEARQKAIEQQKVQQQLLDDEIKGYERRAENFEKYTGLMSEHATDFFTLQMEQRHDNALDELSSETERINNMKISQTAKDRLLKKNQERQKALERNQHNERIDFDIKSLLAEFALMSATTLMNTLMANAKVRATMPPFLQDIPIANNWRNYYQGLAMGGATAAAQSGKLLMQKKAVGADYVTSGPELLMVGENPGGKERVQITPLSSPNFEGPSGGGAPINITFTGNVLSEDFIEDVAIPRIKDAVRRGADIGVG